VFNEIHAGFTNKVSIDQANKFMISLTSGGSDIFSMCLISFHNQTNHKQALTLSSNPGYIDQGKGLSMVDSLLLLQMNDEDGVIYTSDRRMSYYHNSKDRPVARWVNF
jgi:hypothetical protein